jgi:AcrR family transcriptional regulator
MENRLLFRPHPAPPEPSSMERIRDAALKSFAANGVAATSLRTVAEAAGVSIGLVQHYFHKKAALVTAVDDHVLRVIGDALGSAPLPPPPADPLVEAGRRLTTLIAEHSDVVDYLGRALVEGDAIGSVIFDGLFRISQAQGEEFIEHHLARADLDPVWDALNPLILRIGAIILRHHIDRHLPEPFTTPRQLTRWDAAVTDLIRSGQFGDQPHRRRGHRTQDTHSREVTR